jgi:hypothetical protein
VRRLFRTSDGRRASTIRPRRRCDFITLLGGGAAGNVGHQLRSGVCSEYRVTEAADGTFPVELWRSGEGGRCIYKTTGFQTRELAEAWIVPATEVPVEVQSDDPPSPRGRVIYIKPPSP